MQMLKSCSCILAFLTLSLKEIERNTVITQGLQSKEHDNGSFSHLLQGRFLMGHFRSVKRSVLLIS